MGRLWFNCDTFTSQVDKESVTLVSFCQLDTDYTVLTRGKHNCLYQISHGMLVGHFVY